MEKPLSGEGPGIPHEPSTETDPKRYLIDGRL
jgi:hypothetical protein